MKYLIMIALSVIAIFFSGCATTKPTYDLYWTTTISSNIGGDVGGIYGVKRDEMDISTKIIHLRADVRSATVDKAGNIYWTDITNHGIYKAKPDGSNVQKIISDIYRPTVITIDNTRGRIYWINWLDGLKVEVCFADLDNYEKKIILPNSRMSIRSGSGLFYDAIYDKLYLSDYSGGQIIRIDLKTNEFSRLTYAQQPQGIVVDYKNRRVIWADTSDDSISSVTFDGSDKKVLIKFESQFANPTALTIDKVNERLVYIYGEPKKDLHFLETSNLDGSDRKVVNHSIEHSGSSSLFSID
ncbi:SMP-30/gluconolactonase/LRE family protein [Sulfurospirillum oryzae]|uniref:SMP-30/gluconolactonase/LRE family protein n=1 Tax=Sulfurospirillum oryzae TaxID=2976535 RepID=UPI0021E74F9F|nr:DUF5050 domain-containing protein [Sulfurospirillum oryzae]